MSKIFRGKKTKTLRVVVLETDKNEIERCAYIRGMTLSRLVRNILVDFIQKDKLKNYIDDLNRKEK